MAQWQPVIETLVFEVIILNRCIASNVAGMGASFFFLLVKNELSPWIFISDRNGSPSSPPSPPQTGNRRSGQVEPSGDPSGNGNDHNNNPPDFDDSIQDEPDRGSQSR